MLTSPSDVRLAPELVVQPDLYVVPSTIPGRRPRAEGPVSQLTLAVEVLSPGSARYDRIVKRRAYQAAGVQEYWIVDADACVVERWQPGDVRPDMLDAALEWTPPHASLPFRLDLRKFFSAVSDDPADAESGP